MTVKFSTYLLPLLFIAKSSYAIVIVEDIRIDKKIDGFSSTIDISANGARGNSDISAYNAELRIQYNDLLNTYFFASSYAQGKSQGNTNVDKGFLHGRYIRMLKDDLAGELFIQTQRDKFARLASRNLVGLGARYTFIENPTNSIQLGAGLFFESERIIEKENTANDSDDRFRYNLYAVLKLKLNNNLRLVSTTYYQLATDDHSDFLVLENLALINKAGDNLAIKLSLSIAHDSDPPETVEQTDTTYNVGFVYYFGGE